MFIDLTRAQVVMLSSHCYCSSVRVNHVTPLYSGANFESNLAAIMSCELLDVPLIMWPSNCLIRDRKKRVALDKELCEQTR